MTPEPISIVPPSAPTETPQQAHARAQTCHRELQDVLDRHRCRLVPMLTSEPVGSGPGARALVGATYGILPDA